LPASARLGNDLDDQAGTASADGGHPDFPTRTGVHPGISGGWEGFVCPLPRPLTESLFSKGFWLFEAGLEGGLGRKSGRKSGLREICVG
jgi:hypothetical protein